MSQTEDAYESQINTINANQTNFAGNAYDIATALKMGAEGMLDNLNKSRTQFSEARANALASIADRGMYVRSAKSGAIGPGTNPDARSGETIRSGRGIGRGTNPNDTGETISTSGKNRDGTIRGRRRGAERNSYDDAASTIISGIYETAEKEHTEVGWGSKGINIYRYKTEHQAASDENVDLLTRASKRMSEAAEAGNTLDKYATYSGTAAETGYATGSFGSAISQLAKNVGRAQSTAKSQFKSNADTYLYSLDIQRQNLANNVDAANINYSTEIAALNRQLFNDILGIGMSIPGLVEVIKNL